VVPTSELYQRFETATREVRELPQRPADQTLLRLYALYKQAMVGDVSGDRPGFSDLVDRFKYDAWAKVKGMPMEEAMQSYIDLVNTLKA
jgi:acyl-CoA-binding protein